ncbi:hypothetical protein AMJ50_02835 [Parcubacteria bacterium DG_74_3]|nr:MAG: hypothetical protein AMJ50_02835 [Parcubacteria bacterium DG_74_3]
MNGVSKRAIQGLLKKYTVRPSKKLGQNFLIDKKIVKKIVSAANLGSKDTVLEIGPGIGTLTHDLAKKAKKVIAIEKDSKMCEIFKKNLGDLKNVKIIKEDILKISPKSYILYPKSYKVVANLPFYLTAPVIRKFLESKNQPEKMILVVQKEVGQRICAKPPKMSILAVSVQFYAETKIISFVPKVSFWPQPKVDGAIIKIDTRNKEQETRVNKDLFFRIVKAGFVHPRKQLINNLSKALKKNKQEIKDWLLKNQINPNLRAETLTLENWISLTKTYKIK